MKSINDQCKCESKHTEFCCPTDKELRKSWLLTLEEENRQLGNKSREITGKLKIFSSIDRVEILLMLSLRQHCMDEIVRKLKARRSAVSYHLGILIRQL